MPRSPMPIAALAALSLSFTAHADNKAAPAAVHAPATRQMARPTHKTLSAAPKAPVFLQGVHFFQVGKRFAFKPHHVKAASTDKPVVHRMKDLYQEDQKYADLFSKSGQSEICGPTAMSNVMLYLKEHHQPKFPKLLHGEGLPTHATDSEVVHKMFKLCHTSKENGTNSVQLKGCVANVVRQADYGVYDLYIHGIWSDNAARRKPVTPDFLRPLTEDRDPGHHVDRSDKGVVLLFGWYGRHDYKRRGGHYVAVAGHDANHPHTFYVTNPLVNYPKGEWYSKLVLERAPDAKAPHKGMWQTEHLFGDNSEVIAVLEDAVVVLPSEHDSFWDEIALAMADVEGGAGGGAAKASGAVPAATHK